MDAEPLSRVALRGRIQRMTNPVVVAYTMGSLASLVCAHDKIAGSALFSDALRSLDNLPESAFSQRGTTVLPVSSFSGLWKFVMPAALKCDPALDRPEVRERAKVRMDAERRQANATLARASA